MTTTPAKPETEAAASEPAEPPAETGRVRRWYGEHRRVLAIGAGLTLLFTVAAVVMAFPYPHLWRTHTPGDYGDSFLLQWLLRWDFHALSTRGSPVFHPNVFWPHENTLVYTDTQLAIAPFAGVVAKITDWTIAYNVVYLSGWVISASASYALARRIGASRPASVLTGLVFTFAAVRLGHYGHFQLQFAYLVPIALWLLLRFFEERRWWQAAGVGAACAATFLNAGYIALVLAPTLAIVTLGWVVASRFRPGPRFLRGMAVIGIVALMPTFSVLRIYSQIDDQLQREYYHETAVTPRDFLGPVDGTWLYGWLQERINADFENRLFPGFIAIALGVAGAAALVVDGRRRKRRRDEEGAADATDDADVDVKVAEVAEVANDTAGAGGDRARLRRRFLLLFIGASFVPLILAFGEYQTVRGRQIPLPYDWVSDWPGFQSIRAFGRFAVVPLLAGALLVAVGFDWILRRRHTLTRVGVATVLGALMLLEYKGRIVMAPRIDTAQYSAVNHALAKLPYAAVLELPMGDSWEHTWAYVEAPRMVLSSIDWRPRVNGYSGYEPPGYHETTLLFNTLDDGGPAKPEVTGRLNHLRIGYLVIRLAPLDQDTSALGISYLDEAGAQRVIDALPPDWVVNVSREGAALLVQLRPQPPGRPSVP